MPRTATAKKTTATRKQATKPRAEKAAKPTKQPKPAAQTEQPYSDIGFALPAVTAREKARAAQLLELLTKEYPDAHCELDFTSPHELLIATILSAQSTDVGVNKATPALFARFPTPLDYARSTPEEIEKSIKTIGLYRSKAKSIHSAMTAIVEHFGSQVPRTMPELLSLRGVARKTANVVLSNAFHINMGVVVDTHVDRLTKRFGLVDPHDNPQKIERKLMALFPRERWGDVSHLLIFHGRRACKARGHSYADHPICRKFHVAESVVTIEPKPRAKPKRK